MGELQIRLQPRSAFIDVDLEEASPIDPKLRNKGTTGRDSNKGMDKSKGINDKEVCAPKAVPLVFSQAVGNNEHDEANGLSGSGTGALGMIELKDTANTTTSNLSNNVSTSLVLSTLTIT